MARFMVLSIIEPLEPDLWFDEVRTILDRATALDGEAPDALIRKTYFLTCLAPDPLRPMVGTPVDEDHLEGLLEIGAYNEAALSVISPLIGLELTRPALKTQFEVRIQLPDDVSSGRGSGETIAKATIRAWAECFVALGVQVHCLPPTADPVRHKSRSATPRRSTEH